MGSIGVSQAGSIGVNKGSIGVLSQYQSIGVNQDLSGSFGVIGVNQSQFGSIGELSQISIPC